MIKDLFVSTFGENIDKLMEMEEISDELRRDYKEDKEKFLREISYHLDLDDLVAIKSLPFDEYETDIRLELHDYGGKEAPIVNRTDFICLIHAIKDAAYDMGKNGLLELELSLKFHPFVDMDVYHEDLSVEEDTRTIKDSIPQEGSFAEFAQSIESYFDTLSKIICDMNIEIKSRKDVLVALSDIRFLHITLSNIERYRENFLSKDPEVKRGIKALEDCKRAVGEMAELLKERLFFWNSLRS